MALNQVYDFEKREKAAQDLIKENLEKFSKVSKDGSRWLYEGSAGENYEVNMHLQICTCKDHTLRQMGQSDQPCKHLIAVSILNIRGLKI